MADGPDGEDWAALVKELVEFRRDVLGNRPSLRELAKSTGISSSAISNWLSGRTAPWDYESPLKIVDAHRDRIGRVRLSREDLKQAWALLDKRRWKRAQTSRLLQHAGVARDTMNAHKARAALEREGLGHLIEAGATPPGGAFSLSDESVGWPMARRVADLNPLDLGVHRAIEVGTVPLPALTHYVVRAHDEDLRDFLVEGQTHRLAVLVGESSTGKTRALLEAAVAPGLADAPFFVFSDPDDLSGLLVSGLPPRAVLWLDELQSYLSGEGGSARAVALHRLLTGSGEPVVVLATMRSRFWREFMRDDRDEGDGRDELKPVRALLSLECVRSFLVGKALDLDEAAASRDPRLLSAVRAAGPKKNVIQVLAGGVRLMDEYALATAEARALISAAVDARNLGHRSPVPHVLLEAAAVGYLENDELDLDVGWFVQTLKQTTRSVLGVRALTNVTVGPVRTIGSATAVNPHEYLLEQVPTAGRTPPPELWRALAEHASSTDTHLLAEAAFQRRHLELAGKLLVRGALDGSAEARTMLDQHLTELTDNPVPWRRWLAAHGCLSSSWALATQEGNTDSDATWSWWRILLESDEVEAMHDLRPALFDAGLEGRAEELLTAAAERGERRAQSALAILLDGYAPNRAADRLRWWQEVEQHDVYAWSSSVQALRDLGRVQEAEEILLERDTETSTWIAQSVIELLVEENRIGEAAALAERKLAGPLRPKARRRLVNWLAEQRWLYGFPSLTRQVVLSRSLSSLEAALAALAEQGYEREAEELRREALARRGPEDLVYLAQQAESEGDLAAAEELLLEDSAKRGFRISRTARLVEFYERHGRVADARSMLEGRLAKGDQVAGFELVELERKNGRPTKALELLRILAETGGAVAARALGSALRAEGEHREAEEWLLRAAREEDREAMRMLTEKWEATYRFAEAVALWEPLASRSRYARAEITRLLLQAGQGAEAEQRLRLHMLNGGNRWTGELEDFLTGRGRAEEAQALRRYGLALDGSTAIPWSLPAPPDV